MRLAWASRGDIHLCCGCSKHKSSVAYIGSLMTDVLYPLCSQCKDMRGNQIEGNKLMTIEEAKVLIVKSKL